MAKFIKGPGAFHPHKAHVATKASEPLQAPKPRHPRDSVSRLGHAAATSLFAKLSEKGFAKDPAQNLAKGLSDAILQFQSQNGLSTTGRLDKATQSALLREGMLGKSTATVLSPDDKVAAFDLKSRAAAWAQFLAQGAASSSTLQSAAHAPEIMTLLQLLITTKMGSGNKTGAQGDLASAAALRNFQRQAGIAVSGQIDAATIRALVKSGVISKSQGDGLLSQLALQQTQTGNRTSLPTENPSATAQSGKAAEAATSTTERLRTQSDAATKEPTGKGTVEQHGDVDSLHGDATMVARGRHSGRSGAGEHSGVDENSDDESGSKRNNDVDDDDEGNERDRGHASSGDDDFSDLDRGYAMLKEEIPDHVGYYRIVALTEQVDRYLECIRREETTDRDAVTYQLELSLYRPGTYGAGQKAEKLLHVVVTQASAYDSTWTQARTAIEKTMTQYEPHSTPPSADAILAAIRRARVRSGDDVYVKINDD